jgi:hypothetical protein
MVAVIHEKEVFGCRLVDHVGQFGNLIKGWAITLSPLRDFIYSIGRTVSMAMRSGLQRLDPELDEDFDVLRDIVRRRSGRAFMGSPPALYKTHHPVWIAHPCSRRFMSDWPVRLELFYSGNFPRSKSLGSDNAMDSFEVYNVHTPKQVGVQ